MLRRLSIQAKLILLVVAISLAAIGTIGNIGFASGRDALMESIYLRLTGIRQNKANLLRVTLESIRNATLTAAQIRRLADAMNAFSEAFRELDSKPVPKEADEGLDAFYRDKFLPALAANLSAEPVLEVIRPRGFAARYLQYHYIARNPNEYEKGAGLEAAEDGSAYSAAHRAYHPSITVLCERFGFEDLMLVDPETLDIVYSNQKTVEFATNLDSGPYASTALAELARAARKSMDMGDYRFADYEFYRPNLNKPSAFIATPIFDGSKMTGILVVQFPMNEVTRILTGDRQWEKEGLGKTGEVYLVGPDRLFRSRSRFMMEDPEETLAKLSASGVPASTVDAIRRLGMVTLLLPVDTQAARAAIAGREFLGVHDDYRGVPVLASAGPFDYEGIRWAILAEIDAQEAFAPVREYGRKLLATATGLTLATSLLGMLLSRAFTRPLRRLTDAARKVAAGRTDVAVNLRSDDEFRELGNAFDLMVQNLRAKTEQLEHKVRENEQLLLNILPGPVAARRLEAGEVGDDGPVSDTYSDVTVLYAEILGLEESAGALPDDIALMLLNDLIVAFDDAADRLGVEKVKSIGSTYLAVCGMSVQRPDHANRIIEFALQLRRIVDRFNAERGTHLTLQVGVNAGPVVGGIVGRRKYIYDLWGDTVSAARSLSAAPGQSGSIRVTRGVYERVLDTHRFEPAEQVEIKGKGALETWELTTAERPSGGERSTGPRRVTV